jgi:hypothetical protein
MYLICSRVGTDRRTSVRWRHHCWLGMKMDVLDCDYDGKPLLPHYPLSLMADDRASLACVLVLYAFC